MQKMILLRNQQTFFTPQKFAMSKLSVSVALQTDGHSYLG